jgi:hypothetical protein
LEDGVTLTRRGSAAKTHQARRAWLLAHPERMLGVPGLHDDVDERGSMALEILRAELVSLHLLGTTKDTHRETIRRLVTELRGEPTGGGHW